MSDASSKPRVLLSILRCNYFEHLEGELLFTAISAGFGRFECERLLKPSGVELMNLPRSANIEVSVLRWCPADQDGERQKQLLYHGLVSLSAVHPAFSKNADGVLQPTPEGEPQVWENWLGLFSSDVNLKTQSPERLFQRCLEMGTSSARFPRLLLRLQYMPPGVPSMPRAPAQAERSVGSGYDLAKEASRATPLLSQSTQAGKPEATGSLASSHALVSSVGSAGLVDTAAVHSGSMGHMRCGHPSGGHAPADEDWRIKYEELHRLSENNKITWAKQRAHLELQLENLRDASRGGAGDGGAKGLAGNHQLESELARQRREIEELQARCQELEGENVRLRDRDSGRCDEESFLNLVEEALMRAVGGEHGQAGFDEWVAGLGDEDRFRLTGTACKARIFAACRRAARSRSKDGVHQRSGDAPLESEMVFYRPVKTDPIDCLLAASLLRLEREPPSMAELARIEPGLYRCGAAGSKFRCHIDGGRLMVQPADASGEGDGRAAMEFKDFLAAGPEALMAC